MLKIKDNVEFSGSVVQSLEYLLKCGESGGDAYNNLLIRIL